MSQALAGHRPSGPEMHRFMVITSEQQGRFWETLSLFLKLRPLYAHKIFYIECIIFQIGKMRRIKTKLKK